MCPAKNRNSRSSAARRLHVDNDELMLLAETDIDAIVESVDAVKPDILIVDSIQTLYHADNTSSPGSVSQVKECTMLLMQLAKSTGLRFLWLATSTRRGAIAGPKVLEHMVDCVLYFEGEQTSNYRIFRAVKNRFGSTNEIGVFEMEQNGLVEVPNPSEMLLLGGRSTRRHVRGMCDGGFTAGDGRDSGAVARTSFNVPRRTTDGFDFNRANLLFAVLEKRGGLNIGMRVTGISMSSADCSSMSRRPIWHWCWRSRRAIATSRWTLT